MEPIITGVTFHPDELLQIGTTGDNFDNTWGPDDKVYFSYCDGSLFPEVEGFPQERINHGLFRAAGGPTDYTIECLSGFPYYPWEGRKHYGYGTLSVDGRLYHFMSIKHHGNYLYFHGSKLVYSDDLGSSWSYHNGREISDDLLDVNGKNTLFWEEGRHWSFSQCSIVQCGQDYSLAKDDYVYIYAPYGRNPEDPDNSWNQRTHDLCLARVPKRQLVEKSAYSYFQRYDADGSAVWTDDMENLGFVCEFPREYHSYSWFPSVVYNTALDRYIMAVGATGHDGNEPWHGPVAKLMLLSSPTPYGPWVAFYDGDWSFDAEGYHYYQPKLSCKFIENDGRDMYLLFSATADHDWIGPWYRFNQVRMTLDLE
jgi:hypothetical protein